METGDQVIEDGDTRKIHSRHIVSQPFTQQAEKTGSAAYIQQILFSGRKEGRKEGSCAPKEAEWGGASVGLAEALNSAPVCLCFFNRRTWRFKRRANPCKKAARDKPSPPLKARIK